MESCPSGRRCSTRNAVSRKGPRVRIPNSPPSRRKLHIACGGFFTKFTGAIIPQRVLFQKRSRCACAARLKRSRDAPASCQPFSGTQGVESIYQNPKTPFPYMETISEQAMICLLRLFYKVGALPHRCPRWKICCAWLACWVGTI